MSAPSSAGGGQKSGHDLTFDGVLGARDDDMLDGIDAAIHHLDDLVQGDEGGLQAGELDQRLYGPAVGLATALDLLAALAQAGEAKVVLGVVGGEGFELGEEDTGDVLLLGAQAEARRLDGFLDLVGDVAAADGVGDFGEGEGRDLHDAAHFALGFVDAPGYF
jgi:hypothetical protein